MTEYNRLNIALSLAGYARNKNLTFSIKPREEKSRYNGYGGSHDLETPDVYTDITFKKGGDIVAKITLSHEIIESGIPFPLIPRIEVDGEVVRVEDDKNPLGAFAGNYTGPAYLKTDNRTKNK
ncbi:MAG: hypothetical protein JW716_02325 [Candidatus Aenigmarchaeota archaeon]|nr:hypothetical protein [Candidatus Aenigmarchaeota archaeon]